MSFQWHDFVVTGKMRCYHPGRIPGQTGPHICIYVCMWVWLCVQMYVMHTDMFVCVCTHTRAHVCVLGDWGGRTVITIQNWFSHWRSRNWICQISERLSHPQVLTHNRLIKRFINANCLIYSEKSNYWRFWRPPTCWPEDSLSRPLNSKTCGYPLWLSVDLHIPPATVYLSNPTCWEDIDMLSHRKSCDSQKMVWLARQIMSMLLLACIIKLPWPAPDPNICVCYSKVLSANINTGLPREICLGVLIFQSNL